MEDEGRSAIGFVKSMYARRGNPYAGADLPPAKNALHGLLAITALLCVCFLPLEPVDGRIGSAGWVVAALVLAAWTAGVVALAQRDVGWPGLLLLCYGAVAGVAVLGWLSGSPTSAYTSFLLIWAGASAVHPPRRSLPVVLTAVLCVWIPFIADGGGSELAGRLAAESVLILTVGFVLGAILFDVRHQRLRAEHTGRLARMDQLTGLGNRFAFDEAVAVEIARSRRESAPLSVGIADLDDLKGINDRHGHLEGDRCISEAARAIELSVRMTDRCFRWGGDEFVIVLPGAARGTAEEVLERMADGVAAVCETEDRRPVTLTYGCAEFEEGMSIDDVMSLADLSLLGNKPAKRD
ncbi:MAG: GGDEF domain-containing protein [Thermoleophilaceae bacterium]|nr:GGDEF domain-containing protein [Thermoleophilaceae bacterium]